MVGVKSVALNFSSVLCLRSTENRLRATYDGPQMLSAICIHISLLTKKESATILEKPPNQTGQ